MYFYQYDKKPMGFGISLLFIFVCRKEARIALLLRRRRLPLVVAGRTERATGERCCPIPDSFFLAPIHPLHPSRTFDSWQSDVFSLDRPIPKLPLHLITST